MQYCSVDLKFLNYCGEFLANCKAFEQKDGFQICLPLPNLSLYYRQKHVDKIRKFRLLEEDTVLGWKAWYVVGAHLKCDVGQEPF